MTHCLHNSPVDENDSHNKSIYMYSESAIVTAHTIFWFELIIVKLLPQVIPKDATLSAVYLALGKGLCATTSKTKQNINK